MPGDVVDCARRAVIFGVALAIPSATLARQRAPLPSRCLDSIPASSMRRAPVYAAAELEGAPPEGPMPPAGVDLLTQAAARMLLGAGAGQPPPGDDRHLAAPRRIAVVARRDGRLSWSVQPPN
jgi:hypothetical protein